jgi:hypothetical protein
MTVPLITAMHAAETLAAHHRLLAESSTGVTREYHLEMFQRCLDDIENIRKRIEAGGTMPDDRAHVSRQRDVATAQAIIARHVLPEWLASEQAPHALEGMSQDIANALAAERGELPAA